MQTRALTSIPLLLLSAALIAGPAFAADTMAGGKGSAAAGASRDAPLTLPAKAAPRPVPKIDPASLARGPLALDPAAALDSMGTVTLSRDGSVSRQPASTGMRAILDEEMKGSGKGTPGATVQGKDDRTQITHIDVNTYPESTVGWLWTQDQKGDWTTCTGTLIGTKYVLTAAHCVYDSPTATFVKAMTFIPGETDSKTAPFGQFDWEHVNVLQGFVDNYDGKNYGSVMPWDLAVIELSDTAGTQAGYMGFRVDNGKDFHAIMVSYPGDKPDGTMWTQTCDVPTKDFGDEVFKHSCDTAPGSSGAALYEDSTGKGEWYIRGINVAEDDNNNYGLRITGTTFQFISDLLQ
jgi:V8-like Glu-specific endopeptidase